MNPTHLIHTLANASEDTCFVIVLDNEASFDDEGWALVAPYGEHKLTRNIKGPGGAVVQQKFVQVFDESAADAVLSNENSMFKRVKRALFGLSVYKGHPDLTKYEPTVLTNAGHGKPVTLAQVDKLRKTGRGLEAHFNLLPEAEPIIANEGCKFPSVLWQVKPTGERDGAIIASPFKLLSIGLTPHPNISGVDALANARPQEHGGEPENPNDTMQKQLTAWLLAQGIILANSATDEEVLAAIQKRVTTLSNEINTHTAMITTLTNERDTVKRDLGEKTTALANAQTQFKDERKNHSAAVIDLGINQGRIKVADREKEITTLSNAADFAAASKEVLARARQFKTTGTDATDTKALANANMADPRKLFLGKVQKEVAGGMKYNDAYNYVKAENPALVEAMAAQK